MGDIMEIERILDSYIEWQSIIESDDYKKMTQNEMERLRLSHDEDAKYYKEIGLSDKRALHADTIFSFWTIYKTLLQREANWNAYKTVKSLKYLKGKIEKNDEKISEVNKMIEPFADVCYLKGNFMLLPEGCRAMNNQRYQIAEDRIDVTLHQCFGKGVLAKFFPTDEAVISWVHDQKLEKLFVDDDIRLEKVKWLVKEKSPKLISEMSTHEIMEYVESAMVFIKERDAML